ncbi:hypothetical protein HMPREF9347_02753 [Escherichia coli MS 124-1]|uniref:Uncharacterized protein n=1 Tax=Escherichia coli MS 85-1 TaxID=679202 RepID=A0AAN3M4B9_ECOLX|nr:hypothetical protein HMPREF9347_02753 [Escherichia coli MS 124-1]EFU32382.1 hypothetical protein HMPREF9350_05799 [Escherichia coli MS 85-1]
MWQLIFARCFCEQLLSGLFVFVYLFSYRSDHFFFQLCDLALVNSMLN